MSWEEERDVSTFRRLVLPFSFERKEIALSTSRARSDPRLHRAVAMHPLVRHYPPDAGLHEVR